MQKIWLVEYHDYDGGNVMSAWDNEAAAEHHAAALNEKHGGNDYSVDEYEVGSVSTHRVERWWQCTDTWDKITGYRTYTHERRKIVEGDGPKAIDADSPVERFRSTHPNPGYVRDTPNASTPDIPGGRYITTPCWGVTVRDRDEATAQKRARTLLDATLVLDNAAEQV